MELVMNLDGAREVLIRHARSPKNGLFPLDTDRSGRLLNPICGDQVEFRVRIGNDRIQAIGFSTKACAICSAAASMLTDFAKGLTLEEVSGMRDAFEKAVSDAETAMWPAHLAAFESFAHLRVNPRRRACAVLPWLALSKSVRG